MRDIPQEWMSWHGNCYVGNRTAIPECRLDGLSIGLKSSWFLSDFGKMHAAVAKREIILYNRW